MKRVHLIKDFIYEKGKLKWHDSDAPDANGRFRDLSPKDLAAWLIKTRKGDMKKISGSLSQQVAFNKNDDKEYVKKMDKTRKEVYKQLDRDDLLENTTNKPMKKFHEQLDRDDLLKNTIVEAKPGPDPYHRGLDDEDVEDKEDQIKKQADMKDNDPDAYKEMPGDEAARKNGEVKTSKATKKYSDLYGDDENESVSTLNFLKQKEKIKSSIKKVDLFESFIAKESALTERVVYNSSNTHPSAAKKAKKEFGDLLPKANKGIPPYVFAVIKTGRRNYRLAIKSGGYIAHEFMTNLKDDGILTAEIVKNAVDNIIKLNPDEFNESVITEKRYPSFNFGMKNQYDADDINQMYGFWGTLDVHMETEKIEEIWNEVWEILTKGWKFSDAGALYYLNAKAGRWLADKVWNDINSQISQPDAIDMILSDYARPSKWKAWSKEYNTFAQEELAESAVNEHSFEGEMARDLKDKGVRFKKGDKVTLEIQPNNYVIYGPNKKQIVLDKRDFEGAIDQYVIYESLVNEEKIKYAKGKTYQSSGHWTVMVDSNSSLCNIRVNSSAGWRLDPHDDREETWELLDGGTQRATIYFRSGNIDKFAKQMFDLNDRTTWGNKTKLTAKDYADIIRVWIDMRKANESVVNEEKAEGDRGPLDDDKIETALKKKAKDTGVPIGIIRIIMRRGLAAWKSGHRPGATQQMWGYARVNAFLTKGDGTWGGADKDVAKEVRDGGHDKGLKESVLNEEDTYNDYPAAAKKNAQMAIDWKEEYGRDEVDAGTPVGWARAHQLAKGENLSADTVGRMSAFNRHRKNSSIKPELKETPWKDRGYVAWLIWGGDEGVDWATEKMKEIKE